MGTIAAWLMTMAGPLLIKALIAIGVGTVTFTGVVAALDGVIQIAQTSWASMGSDVLQLAGLAGVPEALGIICGAMVARVAVWVAASATKWVVSPSS